MIEAAAVHAATTARRAANTGALVSDSVFGAADAAAKLAYAIVFAVEAGPEAVAQCCDRAALAIDAVAYARYCDHLRPSNAQRGALAARRAAWHKFALKLVHLIDEQIDPPQFS
ncbi:MAG: hypothetical protein B7Z20_11495 [Sphingobium sp. 32-64-5]|nr:MAG: hypothetical protein B7Z20_11495 [Sphingobium sp. 32-64-5]